MRCVVTSNYLRDQGKAPFSRDYSRHSASSKPQPPLVIFPRASIHSIVRSRASSAGRLRAARPDGLGRGGREKPREDAGVRGGGGVAGSSPRGARRGPLQRHARQPGVPRRRRLQRGRGGRRLVRHGARVGWTALRRPASVGFSLPHPHFPPLPSPLSSPFLTT